MTDDPRRPAALQRAWPAAIALSLLLLAGCGGGDETTTVAAARPLAVAAATAGEMASPLRGAVLLNTTTPAQVAAALQAAGAGGYGLAPAYEVRSYRLTYRTVDGRGNRVVASGLLSVPVKPAGTPSPLMSYQHGTIFYDAEAPSNDATPIQPAIVFASLGYVAMAADYVGYGSTKGTAHPYLLSAPSAAAVIDLLAAARAWRWSNGVADNGQLFMTGYSEGGYVTMAAQRALQAGTSPEKAQLVGSAPGAGPYQVRVTLDALLADLRTKYPWLATLLDPRVLSQASPSVREDVKRLLLAALIPADTDVAFQTTFLDNYLANDNAAIERDSNVHDWAPSGAVRMFHGRDDRTVPYAAATATLQAMQARGSQAATLVDCTATPASHTGCVPQYFGYVLQLLAGAARDL